MSEGKEGSWILRRLLASNRVGEEGGSKRGGGHEWIMTGFICALIPFLATADEQLFLASETDKAGR